MEQPRSEYMIIAKMICPTGHKEKSDGICKKSVASLVFIIKPGYEIWTMFVITAQPRFFSA